MRVIYITCFADPWLKVAKVLQEKYGFVPVYWIGYEDDNSEKLVPKAFPNCIYQDYYNAWKGVFPPQIAKHASETYINIDFIKEYASFELQAIKMMDRMDPDQYSFNFQERQRHYRNMIKLCSACLNYLKVDAVICDWVPHRLFDYVLYLLCRFYNRKFLFLGNTQFSGRVIPLTNLSSISDQIFIDYENILRSGMDELLLKSKLPDDIIQSFNKIQQNFNGISSDNVRIHLQTSRKNSGFFSLFKKFIKDVSRNYRSKYFGANGFFIKGIPTYFKQKNKSIEESQFSIIRYSLNKLKANRYKTRLKKYYQSLTIQPDYNVKYVFFPLHYQPELTTSPSGDIFVDQRLCIEVLHKQIPSDYLIYVKEHPVMFASHLEGHSSRAKYFYDDLLSYSRVRLIPSDSNSYELIRNAQAVATIRGTIGWEAMALGKPVIAFGLIWYEKYEGVIKITNEEIASKIKEFILNFKFDKQRLFAYLNAFCKNSSLVYPYRGIKEKVNVSEIDCIERLVNLIQDSIIFDQSK
jgi:hypothetical protein